MKTQTIPLLAAMYVFGVTVTATAQQPRPDPAIIAIDAAIDSLKRQPNQFTLSVTAIGAVGIASGGGIDITVETHGGGPGSQRIGASRA